MNFSPIPNINMSAMLDPMNFYVSLRLYVDDPMIVFAATNLFMLALRLYVDDSQHKHVSEEHRFGPLTCTCT